MSSLTTNLKLVKPELQDNITPTIFADNFDKIDAALEGVSGGALSLEEIEASTNLDGKIPSAAALKEVNSSLVANSKHFYFDYKNGKYGYNTNPNRGADTFFPFKSSYETISNSTGKGTSITKSAPINYKGIIVSQMLSTFMGNNSYSIKINGTDKTSNALCSSDGVVLFLPIDGNSGDTITITRTVDYGTCNIAFIN